MFHLLALLGLAVQGGAGPPADSVARLVFIDTLMTATGGLASDKIVDVAVSSDGAIYALMADGVIRQYQGGDLLRTWGGEGTAPGTFTTPRGIATGPAGVYVFDRRLQAISVFDKTGAFLHREILPLEIVPFHSMVVARDGKIYIAGFAERMPDAQVHVLCPEISCHIQSLIESRPTRNPAAKRFFQGGFLAFQGTGLIFAALNPYRLVRVDPVSGIAITVAHDDLLRDGEAIAFHVNADSTWTITNRYPRTTGIVLLASGNLLYTAILPDRAATAIRVVAPDGHVRASTEVPTNFTIAGVLPNGTLVFLRYTRRQELSLYRLAAGAA